MLANQRLELADRLGVAAERKIGFQEQLERGQPQLLEPSGLAERECFVLDVRKRPPPPQAERLAQHLPRLLGRIVCKQAPTLVEQALEAVDIESARGDPQPVPRRSRLDHVRAEHLAQPRHVHLNGRHRRGGRLVSQELVDNPRRRRHLVRPEQQDDKQRALLLRAERQLAIVPPDNDRAENAEFQEPNLAVRAGIPATERAVRDDAHGNRQPVRDEPVGERGEERIPRRDAGEGQRPDEPGLHEAEAAGCERDQGEQLAGRVGEDHQRRPRLGADGLQRAEERGVVQHRAAGPGDDRGLPAPADRPLHEVTLREERLRQARERAVRRTVRFSSHSIHRPTKWSGRSEANAATPAATSSTSSAAPR